MNRIFILYLFFCFSCSQENNFSKINPDPKLEVLSIGDIEYFKSLNVDSLYSEMFYVIPETNDFNRIGSYDKVVIEDSLIYIMDKTFTHSVLCFDFSGKTIFKLSKLGSGPSEYREIRDFIVDVNSETLEVLDFGGRRVKKYHYKTGEYLEEIRFPSFDISYEAFEKFGENYVVSHGANCGFNSQCGDLSVVDSDFTNIRTYIPVDEYLNESNYKGSNHFSRNMNVILFKEVYNDTIYKINQATGIPEYRFIVDFDPIRMPSSIRFSSEIRDFGELSRKALDQNFSWGIHSFFQAGNYLFFYYEGRALTNVIYNLKRNKGYRFDVPTTRNGNLFLTGRVVGAYGEYFVSFQDSENISRYARGFFGKDSVILRSEYPKMYELMKNVQSGDNGILTFFKIDIK